MFALYNRIGFRRWPSAFVVANIIGKKLKNGTEKVKIFLNYLIHEFVNKFVNQIYLLFYICSKTWTLAKAFEKRLA
jgi:hypothetical protein